MTQPLDKLKNRLIRMARRNNKLLGRGQAIANIERASTIEEANAAFEAWANTIVHRAQPQPKEPLPSVDRRPRDLLAIVMDLKSRGYRPVHWRKDDKGIRVDEDGKFQVPQTGDRPNICLTHGNAVSTVSETHGGPGGGRGVIIVAVHPCLFCTMPENPNQGD